MKKVFYILTAALIAGACTRQFEPAIIQDTAEDGPKVTVEFSVPMPLNTKAGMAHAPEIETIHIAVFNKSGLLKDYVKATLENKEEVKNGPENATATFTADLTMALSPRIVHFIANSPYDTREDLPTTTGEQNVIQSLVTTDGQAAYWQRFELDKIDAYKYAGGKYGEYGEDGATSYTYQEGGIDITVNVGDYIKRDGRKVLDGTGYFASATLSETLKLVPLVRNFAEISVKSVAGSNFTVQQVALGNVPTAGYIAAFQQGTNNYASVYTNAKTALTYTEVKESGYAGTIPESATIDTEMPAPVAVDSWFGYMYERPVPTSDPTCVLVGGELSGESGTRWFKIELSDPDGAYFPIYRGISYEIEIGKIEGSNGYESASDAWAAPAIGDISNSVETKTLEQISDGLGTTLWVEYIDYIGMEKATSSADIYYTMFYKDPSSTSSTIQYLYDNVELTAAESNYPAISKDSAGEFEISIADGTFTTGTPDATKTWKKATITLNAANSQQAQKSVLTIAGKSHVGKDMHRDVTFRVINELTFLDLAATSLANESIDQVTTLTITLPADLGYSMFPIILKIEAENNAFMSSDGLPVESGPSLFSEDGSKNSFYFLKTIDYSDYYNAETEVTTQIFTCKFKTTRNGSTGSSNATTFRVIDKVKVNRTAPFFTHKDCSVSVRS